MSEWISVSAALPKPGQAVIIKGGQSGIYQGLLNHNCPLEWWFTENKNKPDRIKRVDFWMPGRVTKK